MNIKGRVVVYSIVGCPHCMNAKNILQDHQLPYTDISLDTYPHVKEYVRNRSGKVSVPQIFFNNIHIGGNEDLLAVIANKVEWEKLLDEVKNNFPPSDSPEVPDPSTAVKDGGESAFVCEPDEYARLVAELKESGLIKNHRSGLSTHKKSFSGKEFVDWVVKTKRLDRSRAIEMGQQLIDRHFGHHVSEEETFQDDTVYYKLLEDDVSSSLNHADMSSFESRPPAELSEELRRLVLKIYSAYLSPDGKRVNYKGISESQEFTTYTDLCKELVRVEISKATHNVKLAFFINVYNALVIHGCIVRGPPVNLWQRYKFFNTVQYTVGGYDYSLQDIENGVLRGNRRGVGMFKCPFGKSDPRLKVALEKVEPLIHFALVCGAKSCPPIKTYTATGIDAQLHVAAESFLEGEDGCQIVKPKQEVKLSQIFKWYREDFGSNNKEVCQFVLDHMPEGEKKQHLSELVTSGNFKIAYLPYDWGVNAK